MPFDYPVAGASAPVTGGTQKEEGMSLKDYDVVINGYPTTLRLSDEDAKRKGLFKEPAKAAKAETPAPAKKAPAKKAATPRNKARKTTANKKA